MLIKDANNQLKKNEADVVLDSLLEDLDQTANGPEIDQASKELKNDATVDKAPEAEEVKIDNADVFPADEHEQAEEAKEAVVESEQAANGPEIEQAPAELKDEATEKGEATEAEVKVDNADVFPADEHEQSEEAKDVVVESDQVANGPEIDQPAAELKDEATEKGEASEAEVKIDNADVFPADEHEQSEEAKEVVVTEANAMKMMKAVNKSVEKGGNATAKAAEKSDKANNAAESANRVANGENKTVVKAETKAKDAAAHEKKVTTVSNNATTRAKNDMGGETAYNRASKAAENISKDQAVAAEAKAKGKKDAIKTAEARKKAARGEKNIFKKIGKRLGLAEEAEIDLNQVAEYELMKVLDESGYEPSIENVKLLREDPSLFEDELETNPSVNDAEVAGVAADAEAPAAEVVPAEDAKETIDNLLDAEPAKEGEEEAKAEEAPVEAEKAEEADELSESMKKIFSLVDALNENLSQTANGPEIDSLNGELKDEATTAGQATETEVKINNADVFPADEHEQSEEAKEVVVTEENADDKKANEKIDKEMRDQAKKNIEDQPEGKEKEKAKEFAKAHPELFESEQVANGPEIEQAPAELKDEATEKGEATEAEVKVDNADVYPSDEHKQDEEAKDVVVESEQVANGPEIEQASAELKDEATEKGEGTVENPEIKNADVYCDCTHTSVTDVVGVVVESVREVKAAGEKATIETITEAVKKKLKADKVALDDAKAEKKAEKINESVQYNSLREACLLDEDYFQTDSYIKETATEKVEKLTEQVALLIAREQNDPMYDELLKESAYVMRLQEALVKKYKKRAEDKNRGIIGMGGSGLIGHADQDEKRS